MRKNLLRLFVSIVLLATLPLQGLAAFAMTGCEMPAQSHHSTIANDSDAAAHTHNTADASDKCHTCAPCCVGALIQVSTIRSFSPQPTQGDFPDLASHHVSPALPGLDRPPQPLLA